MDIYGPSKADRGGLIPRAFEDEDSLTCPRPYILLKALKGSSPPSLDNARAVCEQDIEFANYKGSVF